MISEILSILKTGLSLWKDDRSMAFEEERQELEDRINAEWAKPQMDRDMDLIDQLDRRVFQLGKRFSDAVARQNALNK